MAALGGSMACPRVRACHALLALVAFAIGSLLSWSVLAAPSTVSFEFNIAGTVCCHHPIPLCNVPFTGAGTGTIGTDKSMSADVTETAVVLSSRIHFEGRMGARPNPAPGGGTAQVRVAGPNRLQLIWTMINSSIVITINVSGNSCTANFASVLKRGQTEHSLYDGTVYHYCEQPIVQSTSCQIH